MKIIIKIEKLNFYSKDKDGKELMTRYGKSYIKAQINGKIYLNIFNAEQKDLLKVGQEVELDVEQNGQYTNYSLLKPKTEIELKIEELEVRITRVEAAAGLNNPQYNPEMIRKDRLQNPNYENQENQEEDNQEMPF